MSLRDGLSGGHGVAGVIQSSPPAQTYQRTGHMIVHPVAYNSCAFDTARRFYQEFPDLKFEDDLLDYMRTGFVCIRPTIFFLAKVVNQDGELMWFVRIAVGDLIELLMAMPFYLPRMCFCRNNRADKMRICSTKRLCQLAVRTLKGNKTWAAAA